MKYLYILTALFIVFSGNAQQPKTLNPSEIYHEIEKLNVLASALYIAAHPDDENTQMISYLSNQVKAETAYLSLTRGNGGQNLISEELNQPLGIIRTYELYNARKIDGGTQFFSTADDFGFSKLPQEAFEKWNKEHVLGEMIYTIRQWQPDIIINRFDHRKEGTTHGHHTASAQLSKLAFDDAANNNRFSDQLSSLNTWQSKRLFFNVSWFFFGSRKQFDLADKSNYIPLETGFFYTSLGKSNQEIASLSRSQHQSQGFGDVPVRGNYKDYLELIGGSKMQNSQNLFDGIDTSWNRIPNGTTVGKEIDQLLKDYDFRNPQNNIAALLSIYQKIHALEEGFYKHQKLKRIKEIILQTAGLFLEVSTEKPILALEHPEGFHIEMLNRSQADIKVQQVALFQDKKTIPIQKKLAYNESEWWSDTLYIPKETGYTNVKWLEDGTSYFHQQFEEIKPTTAVFQITINDIPLEISKDIVYKYKDRVKGEVYDFPQILPELNIIPEKSIYISNHKETVTVGVTLQSLQSDISGKVRLKSEKGNTTDWQQISLTNDYPEKKVVFDITPKTSERFMVEFESQNKTYHQNIQFIKYDHIPTQTLMEDATLEVKTMDVKTTPSKIGYVMGAGDRVPEALRDLGYEVDILSEQDINSTNLKKYPAIVMGIRAYNTLQFLQTKQSELLHYVEKGGNLIVQYVTQDIVLNNIGPYPIEIGRDRVTDENAKVHFIDKNHPVLQTPNKITEVDFTDWIQEQGLYYAAAFDTRYTPIFTSADEGETQKNGGLLVGKYGKGNFVYTGLSLFRQLPKGVEGAYKILVNLISIPTHDTE